jgi:hypothetical protein
MDPSVRGSGRIIRPIFDNNRHIPGKLRIAMINICDCSSLFVLIFNIGAAIIHVICQVLIVN